MALRVFARIRAASFSVRNFMRRIQKIDELERVACKNYFKEIVTAQVGWTVHESRSDFTRAYGSRVRAPMIFQPCFLAVETNERMVAKSVAPSAERKPPEIFWRSFIMRPSRSA